MSRGAVTLKPAVSHLARPADCESSTSLRLRCSVFVAGLTRRTGRIWWKSPHRTTVMPPNGFSLMFSFICLSISLRVLSSTYISCFPLEIISSAKCVPCLMSYVDSSTSIRRVWNVETSVLQYHMMQLLVLPFLQNEILLWLLSKGMSSLYHHILP